MLNPLNFLSPEQATENSQNYIVDHWSYSAFRSFCRNEPLFEKRYISQIRETDSSASAIAGKIYHECLAQYFTAMKDKTEPPNITDLLLYAQKKIDFLQPKEVRQTKNKDYVQAKAEIEKSVNKLITSFFEEFDSYANDIQEVLFVEEKFDGFVRILDFDVPIPLHGYPDMVYINKEGELCILDHKSKRAYTDEGKIIISLSGQATAYKLLLETAIEANHEKVANFVKKYPKMKEGLRWFYYFENKVSQNKDGGRQIRRLPIDARETAQLFERILLPGIKSFIAALGDPDYNFGKINPDDPFSEGNEIVEYSLKMANTSLEDLLKGITNPMARKRIAERKEESRRLGIDKLPPKQIQKFINPKLFVSFNTDTMENLKPEERIEHRLRYFGIGARVAKIVDGYTTTNYLLEVGLGTRISQIMRTAPDIASALGQSFVRIQKDLFAENGKSFVVVEVNKADAERKYPVKPDQKDIPTDKVPLGLTNMGEAVIWDYKEHSTPHLLISGATGSGKSHTIKNIIETVSKFGHRVSVIDPKWHEFQSFCVASENEEIYEFLANQVDIMDYIFKSGKKPEQDHFIVFDECADAFAKVLGKDIKDLIKRLAQKGRAAGIHLILASQRFSTKTLDGDIKANFTTRICLTCQKAVDSQVMIDEQGAEKLTGKGDALYISPTSNGIQRMQCYSPTTMK